MNDCNVPKEKICKTPILGVLTSGDYCQVMNAVLRAVIRAAIYLHLDPMAIYDGFRGLVLGDDFISKIQWHDVSGIIAQGGTLIGSTRNPELEILSHESRLKAAFNLLTNDIRKLIVIGDFTALEIIHSFNEEFPSLVNELYEMGKITEQQNKEFNYLQIAFIICSITNDIVGTDVSIGVDTAMHRIVEAVDAISSTACSHKRTFILEVEGKHCGFLGVCAAIACEADYLFIPEKPAELDWPERLAEKIKLERYAGRQRSNIIIITENVKDVDGNIITPDIIKDSINVTLNHEARVTVLGQVQRGGSSSALDRSLACRMGTKAVALLLDRHTNNEKYSIVIAGHRNEIIHIPLGTCFERTIAVRKAIDAQDVNKIRKLRGNIYYRYIELFNEITVLKPKVLRTSNNLLFPRRIAIVLCGTPACGMNAMLKSFIRKCVNRGDSAFAVLGGIEGFIKDEIQELNWSDVTGWVPLGGAEIGSKRHLPERKFTAIAECFRKYKFHGLLIGGGFEAYHTAGQLYEQREYFPEFRIPILVIPATINNNVPGTDLCIGSDTSINEIIKIVDRLRGEHGIIRRTYVIGTMGDYCGYLATMSALTSGADAAYIFEKKFNINDIEADVESIHHRMKMGDRKAFIMTSEIVSSNYTTDFIWRVFAEEGGQDYDCRKDILGHVQQGAKTSSWDRILGTEMGVRGYDWLIKTIEEEVKISCKTGGFISPHTACLLGLHKHKYIVTPLEDLLPLTNFEYKIPINPWWLKLNQLIKILSNMPKANCRKTENLSCIT